MLGHAVRGNYQRATLVAGDLDFRPLVEELVSLGRHVSVVFERSSASQDLLDAADSRVEMTLLQLWNWSSEQFRKSCPLPAESRNEGSPRSPIQRKGMWNGRIVEVFSSATGYILWVQSTENDYSITVTFPDFPRLEAYFREMHGAIEWRD